MTLIQVLLTPEFVLQVSDRRLSAAGQIRDDSYNKAVSWCGMATVGFTGAFAHVDYRCEEPVTEWIAGVLASAITVKDAVDALEERIKELLARLSKWRKYRDRRLTIVMAGIAPDAGTAFFRALSNFEDGTQIFPNGSDTEVHRWGDEVPLHGNRTCYITAGASPGSELDRSVVGPKLATVSQVGGVNNAARYMVRLQRRVAEREKKNGTHLVGEDAMVVSIPANLKRDGMLLMSNTDSDAVHGGSTSNFSFVKAGSFSKERFAPILACDGRVSEFFAWGDGDNQVITFRGIDPPAGR
jgi:hypothetical protein